jgi:hypothetical protein
MVAVIDHHDPHTCTHNCLKNGSGSRTENREERKARALALENDNSWVRMSMTEPAGRLIPDATRYLAAVPCELALFYVKHYLTNFYSFDSC